jgi:hypothetical protein
VKNFLIGLLLGWAAAFWYYTQGDYLRGIGSRAWDVVSAPPPLPRQPAP